MTDLERNKQTAINFYRTMVDEMNPEEAMANYGARYYKQHNPTVADEAAGFEEHFNWIRTCFPHKDLPVRVIAEGEYVAMHMLHMTTPAGLPPFNAPDYKPTMEEYQKHGLTSFDLFRFTEDGKICEHWDSMQWNPYDTTLYNHNGNMDEGAWWDAEKFPPLSAPVCSTGMTTGTTEICDRDKTAENKSLAKAYVEQVLVDKCYDKLDAFVSPDLQHHICYIADGAEAYKEAIRTLPEKQGLDYVLQHRTVAEGNFVYVQSEAHFRGRTTSVVDLFRIEDGKIAETWQAIFIGIPEKFRHNNTLF